MSGAREGPECVDGQNCISSSVEPRVFLRVTVTLMLGHVPVFIGVVPLRTAVSTKQIIRKWAWQTIGLPVPYKFTVERCGRLVHTQLSASAGRLAHCTPLGQNLSWKPVPQGETHSMNILLGAAKRLTVYISLFSPSLSARWRKSFQRLTWGPHKG